MGCSMEKQCKFRTKRNISSHKFEGYKVANKEKDMQGTTIELLQTVVMYLVVQRYVTGGWVCHWIWKEKRVEEGNGKKERDKLLVTICGGRRRLVVDVVYL
ncbi:hypothetical protein E3N88_21793 [Mikania micrantha]|uniref:Uncharacterized protein n=1 Tax=Mikania micrantha TaxID=192012 RepID=A0A5N6N8J7_9ASTR|nr:hypothetical protein E3N88_21793 [Mikania micrantha]